MTKSHPFWNMEITTEQIFEAETQACRIDIRPDLLKEIKSAQPGLASFSRAVMKKLDPQSSFWLLHIVLTAYVLFRNIRGKKLLLIEPETFENITTRNCLTLIDYTDSGADPDHFPQLLDSLCSERYLLQSLWDFDLTSLQDLKESEKKLLPVAAAIIDCLALSTKTKQSKPKATKSRYNLSIAHVSG